jgi:dihydrofolate reductase
MRRLDELEAFSLEQGKEIGTLLFGRRTYEGMAGYWSQETGTIADMMNSIDKAVATRMLDEATWNNTRLLKGEAAEAVRMLKMEEGKDVYVFGSADLLDSLLKAGLVDEYRICVAPVVLGGGNPLFKPQDQQVKMRLESAPTQDRWSDPDLCYGRVACAVACSRFGEHVGAWKTPWSQGMRTKGLSPQARHLKVEAQPQQYSGLNEL